MGCPRARRKLAGWPQHLVARRAARQRKHARRVACGQRALLTPVPAFIVALVFGVITARLGAIVGTRLGLLDHPSAIKPHPRPVPFVGGAAILVALVVTAPLSVVSP